MAPPQVLRPTQGIFQADRQVNRQVNQWAIVLLILGTICIGGTRVEAAESTAIESDLPEEVLRSEILLDGRSSFDGKRLTATEYAELEQEIEQRNAVEPQVAPKIRRLVGLIKFRKFIKRVLPIVPIK